MNIADILTIKSDHTHINWRTENIFICSILPKSIKKKNHHQAIIMEYSSSITRHANLLGNKKFVCGIQDYRSKCVPKVLEGGHIVP